MRYQRPVPIAGALWIEGAVSRRLGIARADMLGRSRSRPVSQARQLAMTLLRDVLGWSYPQIARRYGRHHTTVIHAYRRTHSDPLAMRRALRIVRDLGGDRG